MVLLIEGVDIAWSELLVLRYSETVVGKEKWNHKLTSMNLIINIPRAITITTSLVL